MAFEKFSPKVLSDLNIYFFLALEALEFLDARDGWHMTLDTGHRIYIYICFSINVLSAQVERFLVSLMQDLYE